MFLENPQKEHFDNYTIYVFPRENVATICAHAENSNTSWIDFDDPRHSLPVMILSLGVGQLCSTGSSMLKACAFGFETFIDENSAIGYSIQAAWMDEDRLIHARDVKSAIANAVENIVFICEDSGATYILSDIDYKEAMTYFLANFKSYRRQEGEGVVATTPS